MKDSGLQAESFDKTREQIHRQILSVVSHDLKTPLASIIGCLEIYTRMNEKLTPEKKGMLIQSALGEAYRLDSFITNILDMAKLESGMVNLKKERCDITSLLNDCVLRLGPRGKALQITLRQSGSEKNIHTDPMLLTRVIGLLLDNASKHAGKNPLIKIEYGVDEGKAFIHVSDNGPGIPKGKEKAIFDKYARFSKNDQQNAGTGLGLSICSQIMQLLSGSITVKNQPEGGALFSLSFVSQP